jgi:uncharacterized protein (DUF934 family)
MPQLLRNIDQNWRIFDDGDIHWRAEEDWQAGEPLQVGVDSEPDSTWLEASAIAVDFPALTDGRGLSLAVLLRTRLHYTGDLVARGNVHEDIVHFLARSGFNVIELPEGKDLQTALTWVDPHSGYYQPSVANPQTVFASKN